MASGKRMGPKVGRDYLEPAVAIPGKTRGFKRPRPPAVRAAPEVRVLRIFAVKRPDNRFSQPGHLVDSAVSEVSHLLGMSQRPTRVCPSCGVARIRAHRCVTLVHRGSKLPVANLSGESSVALAL